MGLTGFDSNGWVTERINAVTGKVVNIFNASVRLAA